MLHTQFAVPCLCPELVLATGAHTHAAMSSLLMLFSAHVVVLPFPCRHGAATQHAC